MTKHPTLNELIKQHDAKFVDLRFTDLEGREHHVSLLATKCDANFCKNGKLIDGSSIKGWQAIHESDLALIPDESSAVLDPFTEEVTLNVRCDVYLPHTNRPYVRDPRGVARSAEAYLRSTGIADQCYVGQEVEFFIFDDVRWDIQMNRCFYELDTNEAPWNNATEMDEGNMGHRQRLKSGYFPVPPVDSLHDLRSEMCVTAEDMGLDAEVHHHEVAAGGQVEIIFKYASLLCKADQSQTFKYVARNVAHASQKTVTFMPKPLVGDNGSGLHCHQSLAKEGKNLFAGDGYAGLSELALYYLGGIIHHGRALCAFTNPSTNSYKRLVPGFEAPVTLVYSKGNRSAAIRIPHAFTDVEKRIEIRFPDSLMNPYLGFSALLMAGLDGIRNRIHPGDAVDENLYELTEGRIAELPSLCSSLDQALDSLQNDHAFLLEGGVFSKELIDAFIALKRQDAKRVNMVTHPLEFDLYYSL